MFQHTTNEIPGSSRGCVNISQTTANTKSVAELPVSYTEVAPAVLPNKTPPVPETSSQLQGGRTFNRAMEKELDWLEDVNGTIKNHPSRHITPLQISNGIGLVCPPCLHFCLFFPTKLSPWQ